MGLTRRRGDAEEEEEKQGRGLEKGMERRAEVPLQDVGLSKPKDSIDG